MSKPQKMVIITTCHGRLEHLRKTLPTNSELAPVVVVDGKADKDVRELCEGYKNVSYVPCRSKYFWKTRLLNTGAMNARDRMNPEWLAFVDADVKLTGDRWYGDKLWLDPSQFYIAPKDFPDLTGFLLVNSFDFWQAGGYDIAIRDWGGEDWELRLRLYALLNVRATRLGLNSFSIYHHGDGVRVENHRELFPGQHLPPETRKQLALERNANYIHHKLGVALNDKAPFDYEDVLDLIAMEKRKTEALNEG